MGDFPIVLDVASGVGFAESSDRSALGTGRRARITEQEVGKAGTEFKSAAGQVVGGELPVEVVQTAVVNEPGAVELDAVYFSAEEDLMTADGPIDFIGVLVEVLGAPLRISGIA